MASEVQRVDRVTRLLGKPYDTATMELAYEHVPMVVAFVKAYTRGAGFTGGEPTAELEEVIASASARLINHPGLRSSTVGEVSIQYAPSVDGFTLLELAVLHRYRRRAA